MLIVTNITDAMILHGLLDKLFARGVALLATSNRIPDDLYKNGLQRERFLPAIALIKTRTMVLELAGVTDHRLDLLETLGVFYGPEVPDHELVMEKRFRELVPGAFSRGEVLEVYHRPITTRLCAEDVAWFDFDALCRGPRAVPDYIHIAQCFHTVLLSGVPVFDAALDAEARRFIYLIDALYHHDVKLVLAAAAPPRGLYQGTQLAFPFRRTASRLEEMHSHRYLQRAHRP